MVARPGPRQYATVPVQSDPTPTAGPAHRVGPAVCAGGGKRDPSVRAASGPGHMVAGPLVAVWVPRGSGRWQVAGLERTRTGAVGSSCSPVGEQSSIQVLLILRALYQLYQVMSIIVIILYLSEHSIVQYLLALDCCYFDVTSTYYFIGFLVDTKHITY
jgi:hypothetical protein